MAISHSTGASCARGDAARVALFDVPAAVLASGMAGAARPLPLDGRRHATVWIVDGSQSLYAAPTLDQQADVIERVARSGRVCRQGCPHLDEGCMWAFSGQPAAECAGYVDELERWEQDQLAAMPQEHFDALLGTKGRA